MFTFDIVERVAVLSRDRDTTKELNRISFNGNPPVWDLRRWKDEKMLKGITLTDEEMNALRRVLTK